MSQQVRISKALSYWLRHAPSAGGLSLDQAGWADIKDVCLALANERLPSTSEDIAAVAANSDKNRFEISDDGQRIRARQGHSLSVDGDWKAATPPPKLYHGTIEQFLPAILSEGLRAQQRHHVHLSIDQATAAAVGARRGRPVILEIDSGTMTADGVSFFVTGNGVWLVDHVPSEHIVCLRSMEE